MCSHRQRGVRCAGSCPKCHDFTALPCTGILPSVRGEFPLDRSSMCCGVASRHFALTCRMLLVFRF